MCITKEGKNSGEIKTVSCLLKDAKGKNERIVNFFLSEERTTRVIAPEFQCKKKKEKSGTFLCRVNIQQNKLLGKNAGN